MSIPHPPRNCIYGFTMIELLAVISIIAILSVLLVPVWGNMRKNADAATCVHNMRSTAQGILLYASEHNGYFPPINDHAAAPYPAPNSWLNVIPQHYLGYPATEAGKLEATRRVMRCPTNRKVIVDGSKDINNEQGITKIHQLRTFAMNSNLGPKTTASAVIGDFRTLASITKPSRTIMLSEAMLVTSSSEITCQAELNPGTIVNSLKDAKGNLRAGIHGEHNNIAWCDGHISQWKDVRLLADSNGPYREGKSDDRWSGR